MRQPFPFDARRYYYYPTETRGCKRSSNVGGAAFSLLSLSLFEAMEEQPDDERKGVIDTFILALVDAGVWDKLDCLYVFAAHTQQAALLNWKNPGTFDATIEGTPTFTTDEGFTGNGSDALIDSNFNPTTASSPNISQDDACRFARVLAAGSDSVAAIWGSDVVGSQNRMLLDSTAFSLRIHTGGTAVTGTGGAGFWLARRSGAASQEVFLDNSAAGSNTTASSGMPNGNLTDLWSEGGANFHAGQIASSGVGASLSDAQRTALYNAELAYMQAVGAVA
jgi:hypothetical protein